ncbi:MAG: spore coat protein U domain-containing protein [Bdellovibrio sp.]
MIERIFSLIVILVAQNAFAVNNECHNMQLQAAQTAFDLTSNTNISSNLIVKADTRSAGCNFFVTFDYGSSANYSSRSLNYGISAWPFQIFKDTGNTLVLKNFPQVNDSSDVLAGSLPDKEGNDTQRAVPFYVNVDMSSPWKSNGTYSEWITATLYKGTISNYQFVQSVVLAFYFNAPKRTDISVVPTGGSFSLADTVETLDFGTLSTGTARSCDIIVKYNAGYVLYASSQNNGRLKHETANSYIPYTVNIGGSSINLGSSSSNPVQVRREFGSSPSSGKILPATITIGNYAQEQAGIFNDVITLTVQSAE